jgi:protoheme IX farnesyltransferase
MTSLVATANILREDYWPLVKSRQTLLLTLTGVAGFLCRPTIPINWVHFSGLMVSLLLTISGCTVFNMVVDRDVDREMVRTRQRPLAAGRVKSGNALILGTVFVTLGLLVAATLSRLYLFIIVAGIGLDVVVYTLWLKRRTAWSILWGGFAGGMPILAGSVLAVSRIDSLGILLTLVIVCWIPCHNLTLSTLYSEDYLDAGIPTVLSCYGIAAVHLMVTISSLLVAILIMFLSIQLGFSGLVLAFMFVISLGLMSLGVIAWIQPSSKLTAILYRYSSMYMLVTMLMLSFSSLVL